jgi:hypothetical protein
MANAMDHRALAAPQPGVEHIGMIFGSGTLLLRSKVRLSAAIRLVALARMAAVTLIHRASDKAASVSQHNLRLASERRTHRVYLL